MMTVNQANAALNTATLLGANTLAGLDISAIVALPNHTIVVATDDPDKGGVFVSSDYTMPNVTFVRIPSNLLPAGPVTDLAYIPAGATTGGACSSRPSPAHPASPVKSCRTLVFTSTPPPVLAWALGT